MALVGQVGHTHKIRLLSIMKLLNFINQESTASYHQIIFMAVVSGFANSLLLAHINHAADQVANGDLLAQYFMMYLIVFVLFLYTQWFAYEHAIVAIEEALCNLRIRLADKIRKVELSFIENTGHGSLYTRLTQDNALMSQAIPQLTAAGQVAILIIFSLLYLAIISPISFLISIFAIISGIVLFLSQLRYLKKSLHQVTNKESEYFDSLFHLINGFKEIKINESKSDDIFSQIKKTSQETKTIKISVGHEEMKLWGFGKNASYAILPILVFIIPLFYHEHAADVYKISATMLFISGPITLLVNSIPLLNRINVILDELYGLEEEIDNAIHKTNSGYLPLSNLQTIKLQEVYFSYPQKKNSTSFFVGPFSEHLRIGEILFIIGGNGSGKSTFLKILTGLYYPQNGDIYVNSELISDDNYQSYRELFSIIFTDFHLFDRFYGIKNLDEKQVNYWLERMQMQHKIQYRNNRFSNTDLSTGQRKRLAFIAAILENKPVLILDEFAADQDPGFRKYFYEVILQELKDMGKTVIAVTHDDHYFHVADRVLKMDTGKLIELREFDLKLNS